MTHRGPISDRELLDTTLGSPLAPSVEKAYYRKCIELKRRLNEVSAANDEAKLRRIRLDRAIMKMRLERAFLLEQLSKRTGVDVEGSEGSGDEQVNTPPPDRPHRDKKRKQPGDSPPPSSAPRPSDAATRDSPHASPIQTSRNHDQNTSGSWPSGGSFAAVANGAEADAQRMDIDRGAGVVGDAVGTGSAVYENPDERRRVAAAEDDTGLQ